MAISRKITPTQGRSSDQNPDLKRRESVGEKKVSKKEKISEKKDVSFGLTPHITEKATFLSEKNAYVFKIEPNSTR